MAILAELSPAGTPSEAQILSVIGRFPVAGLAWWQDDWHAYRCCPYPHLHEGLDMFAATGTPVVAAAGGVISQKVDGAISGLGLEITDAGGTQYFYAHLSAFQLGIDLGTEVHIGQVIGFVGNTGDARTTSPHLHFEVQPGGIPVPPIPYVNRWLALSEGRAEALLEAATGHAAVLVGLPDWVQRALALAAAARAMAPTTEGEPDPERVAVAVPVSPVSAGAMIAFAAGAFLLLLVAPGCLLGLRQARAQAYAMAGGGLPVKRGSTTGRSAGRRSRRRKEAPSSTSPRGPVSPEPA